MSERITTTVYGFAPPSAELLQISGDIERGRRPKEDYSGQAAADFGIYSGVLESAGIDFRSGDWAGSSESDYLRDAIRLFSGFKGNPDEGTITRWFDTNTFYRQPVLDGFPEQKEGYPHEKYLQWLKLQDSEAKYQPTFLSPYAFYRLADSGGIPNKNALELSAALYSQLLANAIDSGVDQVLFHEPFIPHESSSADERAKFIDHVKMFAEFYKDLDIGLYFSHGDATEVINDILMQDVPVTTIGADLHKTPFDKIGPVNGRVLLAGLVDGANTLFATDEVLATQLENIYALQSIAAGQGARQVSLTHSVDLEHIPRKYALRKIQQIGRVARLVNGEGKNE